MPGFVRRFTYFPDLATIAAIEGVTIVDLIPPGIFIGRVTGTVALVAEWPKGPFTPTAITGAQQIAQTYGSFSLAMRNPFAPTVNPFSNGCGFTWLKAKKFKRLVLIRVNVDLVNGVKLQLTGTPTPLTRDVTIPAGTRVRNPGTPTQEFALSTDITFAAGTNLAVVAFTAFVAGTTRYSTRTVSAVPVFSVQGVSEGAVGQVTQIDATDLFRAGIGAGTQLPSITVTTTTGALDGAGANGAALTVLNSAAFDTAYQNALDALMPSSNTSTDFISIVGAARNSDAIRLSLLNHVRDASERSNGRVAVIRPPIGTLPASAQGAPAPGVGATRSDRVVYCYPHFLQTIPEINTLDPNAAISPSQIPIGADAAMSVLLSNLPPENNPAQLTDLLTFIEGFESGLTGAGLPTTFDMDDYIAFKAAGIAALHRDANVGAWEFQSGVTSVDPVSFPQLVPIKRRRMSDFVQDSLATIALRFNKLPGTEDRKDAILGEFVEFLEDLLSLKNPARQRISAYAVDDQSGNSSTLEAAGIHVIIVEVRLLSTLDNIVLQTTIGESVEVSAEAA